ncbi:hypothetical protein GJAV_G00057370 [Gymnothorax javanicus]|nr:hypothetical protein GJAV_G00057370 [Gymnothorax javanicus]
MLLSLEGGANFEFGIKFWNTPTQYTFNNNVVCRYHYVYTCCNYKETVEILYQMCLWGNTPPADGTVAQYTSLCISLINQMVTSCKNNLFQ